MIDADIQLGFDTRLQAWADAVPIDVAWEGTVYTPVVGTPYLSVKMAARVLQPIGVGRDGKVQRSGVYQVSLYRPVGDGSRPILLQAAQIADLFPRGHSFVAGVQMVRVERTNMPPSVQMPDWVMVPIEVYWFSN